jgi:dTDP-4-dehydrorhamnose reductase
LVGGAVTRRARQRGWNITGVVAHFAGALPDLDERLQVDLADPAALRTLLSQNRWQAIVNCAAVSEPGDCERDPAQAHALNIGLPGVLAAFARERAVRLVHVSTEQVFDGEHAPYAPEDPVRPINLYGRLKAESEQRVHELAPEAVTVRAPLLMGNSPSGRRSLHERLLAEWMAGRVPKLFRDEIRQVAHADDLAEVLLDLVERTALVGVYHWAGAEAASRWELGERIRAHFNLPEPAAPIEAVVRLDQPASRSRPRDLRLRLDGLIQGLSRQPQTLAEQLVRLQVPEWAEEWRQQVAGRNRA